MRASSPWPSRASFILISGLVAGAPLASAMAAPAEETVDPAAALPAEAASPAPAPADDGSSTNSMQTLASSTWERISDLQAWRGPAHWRVLGAPCTHHWRPSDEHDSVYALALERQHDDRWLLGGSLFTNSFGQPSGYAYLGRRCPGVFNQPPLFFQWSAGVMYGHVGKYRNKVPMNFYGFSPAALISLGWQPSREWSFTLNALGDAALMLQIACDFH